MLKVAVLVEDSFAESHGALIDALLGFGSNGLQIPDDDFTEELELEDLFCPLKRPSGWLLPFLWPLPSDNSKAR